MAFPTAWYKDYGSTARPVQVLTNQGEAYLTIGAVDPDVNQNDESPVLRLLGENNTIAIKASVAAIADGGAFTCDVRRLPRGDGTAETSALVAQLSAATPAAYNCPPGDYIIVCTFAADATGYVWVQGRGPRDL